MTKASRKHGQREPESQASLFPLFSASFMEAHTGRIISDQYLAIVELVANAWDAGGGSVSVSWPATVGAELSVEDNGLGMSKEEFEKRWLTLSYNRLVEQGEEVRFPGDRPQGLRLAFGRSGIGRHAMFCFADTYFVETWQGGRGHVYEVQKSASSHPFVITLKRVTSRSGHGTRLWCKTTRSLMSSDEVSELLGQRFVADPGFEIRVNGSPVALTEILAMADSLSLEMPESKPIPILRFDAQKTDRTSKQHGVALWVRNRLVGTPSWMVYSRPLLDARYAPAKRYTYIVQLDGFAAFVKNDWSGFIACPETATVMRAIEEFIAEDLINLSRDLRRERKRDALVLNGSRLRGLPIVAQVQVATFAEEVQRACPTLTERDLGQLVGLLANLEQSRSQFSLLDRLSMLAPNELDKMDEILAEWSVADMERVLDELGLRLKLIAELETKVHDPQTEELRELQPLFGRGLWIFGPEFESIAFTSNRTLLTVVRDLLGTTASLESPRNRPDFVVIPDGSISAYSEDAFDDSHEVCGLRQVVVVELKKGGFKVGNREKQQAFDYCRELRKSGNVQATTSIVAYVLGASVDPIDENPTIDGNTKILPRTYATVLRQAQARTFHLKNKLQAFSAGTPVDAELEAALSESATLFDAVSP